MLSIVLAATLLLVSLSNTNPVDAQRTASCSNPCVRREFRTLSSADLERYFSALTRLKSTGQYDQYTSDHWNYQEFNHRTPQFLPWHRAFIWRFEQLLQSVDPGLCLHYWSWDVDSQAPEYGAVWGQYYGTNGASGTGCVEDGYAAYWSNSATGGNCLQRQWDGGNFISSWYSAEALNSIITSSNSYDVFRNNLESTAHFLVHLNIGGDFAQMSSAGDPLFYAHHAFIDKIWWRWQLNWPELASTYNGASSRGRRVDISDTLEPLGAQVQDVFDINVLCYQYDDLPATAVVRPATLPAPLATTTTTRRGAVNINRWWDDDVQEQFFEFDDEGMGLRAVAAAVSANTAPWNTTLMTWLDIAGVPRPVNATRNTTTSWSPVPDIVRLPIASDPSVVTKPFTPTVYDPKDRRSLSGLRKPRVIPSTDIQRMQYNETDIRFMEKQMALVYDSLNSLRGYLSQGSLYYRPDVCVGLVRDKHVDAFTVDFYNKGSLEFKYDDKVSSNPQEIVSTVRAKAQHVVPELVKDPSVFEPELVAIIGKDTAEKESASSYMTRPDEQRFSMRPEASAAALNHGVPATQAVVTALLLTAHAVYARL